ncbi:DUF262 domain-containing protein [Alkalihalophilus marmarensis]|uniref:GmrSD restriction endonucleases N-terminal domain-containing protein n=1 Tax=Alkalihalophilus marmarensis DSM 21297 TaxID=1188261 RepID=U6SLW7_9BACI|nr:DUF262 domain-containing protein [Alkalihalophilus marmarensis]ERN51636.1 hypothetical protein A33I_20090 [Alkalihalophilus marmarensis DSM 21297]
MLDQEIKEKSKDIYTDSYSMSVGEIASMYQDGELELQPDYQRFFRWSNTQKSKFIESLMLGIPIPPIFVYQKKDGVWAVVDGLQRLSTILQFMEVLVVDNSEDHVVQELELQGTEFLPSLESKKWSSNGEFNEISTQTKLFFKRSRLDIKIIKYTSDVDAQFELFQRLNTGGTALSPQEIRNSLMVMENKDFYLWFEKLSKNVNFSNCLPLTNRQKSEKVDMEYLLRFLIIRRLKDDEIKGNEDIDPFLTEKMHEIIKDNSFNLEHEEKIFNNVFLFLDSALGEDIFKKFNTEKNKFEGALSTALFEAIIPGIALTLEKSSFEISQVERIQRLEDRIKLLSEDTIYKEKRNQYRPVLRTKELIPYSKVYFDEL